MKVVNNSDKTKHFKIKGSWLSMEPGEIIDLQRNINEPGLDLYEESKEEKKKRLLEENETLKKEGMLHDDYQGEKKENPLDLDRDGDVDKKDASLAGRVMASFRHKKKGN